MFRLLGWRLFRNKVMVSLPAPSRTGKNITCEARYHRGCDLVFAKLPNAQLKVQCLKKKVTRECWDRNRRNCARGILGASLTCGMQDIWVWGLQPSRPAGAEIVVLWIGWGLLCDNTGCQIKTANVINSKNVSCLGIIVYMFKGYWNSQDIGSASISENKITVDLIT